MNRGSSRQIIVDQIPELGARRRGSYKRVIDHGHPVPCRVLDDEGHDVFAYLMSKYPDYDGAEVLFMLQWVPDDWYDRMRNNMNAEWGNDRPGAY